MNKFK